MKRSMGWVRKTTTEQRMVQRARIVLEGAAGKTSKEIVLMLVDAGADVNLQDNSGTRALGFAKMNGHTEIARFLKQNGAKE